MRATATPYNETTKATRVALCMEMLRNAPALPVVSVKAKAATYNTYVQGPDQECM